MRRKWQAAGRRACRSRCSRRRTATSATRSSPTCASSPRDGDDVLVVLPELILRGWRRLLHNQRALYVKRLLLVEPNVLLASVPYHARSDEAPDVRSSPPPRAPPRALDGLDRLPEHRRAAARAGRRRSTRSTSPAGSPPTAARGSSSSRRWSSSASCRSTRTSTASSRALQERLDVGARRSRARTASACGARSSGRAPGSSARRSRASRPSAAPSSSSSARRSSRGAASSRAFPREVLLAAARRAVPRDDRHRSGRGRARPRRALQSRRGTTASPGARARARPRGERALRHRVRQRRLVDLLRPRRNRLLRARADARRLRHRRPLLRGDRGDVRRGDGELPGGRRLVELRAARLQRARLVRGGLGADAQLHHHDRHLGVLRAALPLDLLGAAAAEPVGHRRRRRRHL